MIAIRIPVFNYGAGVMPPPEAWTIRVEGACLQWHTAACQEKDGCFVSAHTKLAGWGKHVVLSTEALGRDFCTAIYPFMRKRHGDGIELTLEFAGLKKTTQQTTQSFWLGFENAISRRTRCQKSSQC